MTDSFNNNVTALSVETPVTFLNACLFVLAILSTISLSDAEPGERPARPSLFFDQKFHRFLFPFSSKFPDLNLAQYVPYIYSCYETRT